MFRIILKFAVVLLVVGEIVVRFDEHTLFFQEARNLILANTYKESVEKSLADTGTMPVRRGDIRIMLLGDSKLYGVGVGPAKSAGALVKAKLQRESNRRSVYLLDLTEPGSNTFYNRRAFDQYQGAVSPQVVILAYNHNDVYGDQGEEQQTRDTSSLTPSPASVTTNTRRDRFLGIVTTARALLGQSHAMTFTLVKLNMELKLAGVIVPGTEFHHLINRSHASDYPGWIASQKHLLAIADACRARHITFIVYIVPELEMLPRYSVFTRLDGYLMNYFKGMGVRSHNGVEPFRKRRGETFALSRYDGHPNEAAHEIIADDLFHEIRAGLTEPSQEPLRSE